MFSLGTLALAGLAGAHRGAADTGPRVRTSEETGATAAADSASVETLSQWCDWETGVMFRPPVGLLLEAVN